MGIMEDARENFSAKAGEFEVTPNDNLTLLNEKSYDWAGDSKLQDFDADDEINRRRRRLEISGS